MVVLWGGGMFIMREVPLEPHLQSKRWPDPPFPHPERTADALSQTMEDG